MAEDVLIAFTTFPESEMAQKAAREIVDLKLAACANIVPQIRSIYRWKGKLESSGEVLVLFKLTADRYAEFETKLRSLHPYEVPEIISCKIDNGLPEYLRWIAESCAS
jgi:periplasmic divalent cation tolerance protein